MKELIHDGFMLLNKTAKILYRDYGEKMPIIDYHCHLDPRDIAQNKSYRNITEVWLRGDHYKWRAMRNNGVNEKYITGDAPDKEKFLKWAATMPYLIGNPLYHWTHLELKRYFKIDALLGPDTAESIWIQCNEMLARPELSARGIIRQSNVRAICTTDDPIDNLEYHQEIQRDTTFAVKVLPTFRPDKAVNIEKEGFRAYVNKLSEVSGIIIHSFSDLQAALRNRIEHFRQVGCRISDHGLEPPVFIKGTALETDLIFRKALQGELLSGSEINLYKTSLLLFLGKEYARLGWVMQLLIGAQRDNNFRMFKKLGPNTGFDMMSDYNYSEVLTRFLDALEMESSLPKTILYVINPRDFEMITTLAGCFQGDGIPGKIQIGSGWWFNDQKDGMQRQMIILASLGMLSRFVGMLTDSRSFLSYTRHEYFRRILCNLLGTWAENGEVPDEPALLGRMVQDIAYYNTKQYFQF